MKKASTWYLVALAVLNVLLAQVTYFTSTSGESAYRYVYGQHRPEFGWLTLGALRLYWWPYIPAGVALVLAVASCFCRTPTTKFLHFVIAILACECLVLMASLVGFILPFISTFGALQ